MKIPRDYKEFLKWFKSETETSWRNISRSDTDDNYYWIKDAKWIGLKEDEIEKIENKYNISFTSEHREFLKVLHAIDKKEPVEYYNDEDEIIIKPTPFFYNWLVDEEEIKRYLNWPFNQILKDVKDGAWLNSWVERPKSEIEVEKIFASWYNGAPKLIPIHSHRFVVNLPNQLTSPVLSIYGADTIVYGWDMKHYLLSELGQFLDVNESVYDDEDKCWYPEPIQELKNFMNNVWAMNEQKGVPIWNELIEYACPNWKYTPFGTVEK